MTTNCASEIDLIDLSEEICIIAKSYYPEVFEPLLCKTSKSARNTTPVCQKFLLHRNRIHVKSVRTHQPDAMIKEVRQPRKAYDCHSLRCQPFRRGAHLPIYKAAVSEAWIISTGRCTAKPRYTRTLLLGPVMLQAHNAIPSPFLRLRACQISSF